MSAPSNGSGSRNAGRPAADFGGIALNLAGIVVAAIVTLLVYRWTSARGRSVA